MFSLTFDLDLQSHSKYDQAACLYLILGPYVKRFSRERARQRDRPGQFYTLNC